MPEVHCMDARLNTAERVARGIFELHQDVPMVIMLHGHPGVGKTHLSRALLDARDSVEDMAVGMVNRDSIKTMLGGDYGGFPREAPCAARMKQIVHDTFFGVAEQLVSSGMSVVMDDTARDVCERKRVVEMVVRNKDKLKKLLFIEVRNRNWMLNRLEEREGLTIDYWTGALSRHVKAYEPLSEVEIGAYSIQTLPVSIAHVVVVNDYRCPRSVLNRG